MKLSTICKVRGSFIKLFHTSEKNFNPPASGRCGIFLCRKLGSHPKMIFFRSFPWNNTWKPYWTFYFFCLYFVFCLCLSCFVFQIGSFNRDFACSFFVRKFLIGLGFLIWPLKRHVDETFHSISFCQGAVIDLYLLSVSLWFEKLAQFLIYSLISYGD